jgi:hypothetical protein
MQRACDSVEPIGNEALLSRGQEVERLKLSAPQFGPALVRVSASDYAIQFIALCSISRSSWCSKAAQSNSPFDPRSTQPLIGG